jgi:hypothetical protein
VILVMTSNLGSELLTGAAGDYATIKSRVLEVVGRSFRPEFINRIDEIVVFRPLGKDEVRRIVDLQLEELAGRLAGRDLRLDVDAPARDELARRGYDPVYGARPLRRTIMNEIENPLAQMLLTENPAPGETVVVRYDGTAFRFERRAGGAAEIAGRAAPCCGPRRPSSLSARRGIPACVSPCFELAPKARGELPELARSRLDRDEDGVVPGYGSEESGKGETVDLESERLGEARLGADEEEIRRAGLDAERREGSVPLFEGDLAVSAPDLADPQAVEAPRERGLGDVHVLFGETREERLLVTDLLLGEKIHDEGIDFTLQPWAHGGGRRGGGEARTNIHGSACLCVMVP